MIFNSSHLISNSCTVCYLLSKLNVQLMQLLCLLTFFSVTVEEQVDTSNLILIDLEACHSGSVHAESCQCHLHLFVFKISICPCDC